jgi:hypothetical protein
MIRCAGRPGRIARIGVCVLAAGAAMAPAVASAQSAVEEYSLDIPGGGSGSSGAGTPSGGAPTAPSAPSAGATSSSAPTDTDAGATGTAPTSAGGERPTPNESKPRHSQRRDEAGEDLEFGEFGGIHEGTIDALDTSSRSAPEVVADTLLDSAMLPVLGALVLITGFGAWRVLRSRGTLSRQVG